MVLLFDGEMDAMVRPYVANEPASSHVNRSKRGTTKRGGEQDTKKSNSGDGASALLRERAVVVTRFAPELCDVGRVGGGGDDG